MERDLILRLRAAPRWTHAALVIASVWIPLALLWADFPVTAAVLMAAGVSTFFIIHPWRRGETAVDVGHQPNAAANEASHDR